MSCCIEEGRRDPEDFQRLRPTSLNLKNQPEENRVAMRSDNHSSVALVRCPSYAEAEVKSAVERGLKLLGGAEAFARPGEKILLKPNLLSGAEPEKCVSTHPSVFKAAAECFLELGCEVSYGDSPGRMRPDVAARKSQLAPVAEQLGIELVDFETGRIRSFPEGIQNKQFMLANGVLAADGLVSLPKLKTHGLSRITGAVKNQFGCIPGLIKGEFHVKLPDPIDFCRMLVDLNRLLKPRLCIMDGVMAMEGNGPGGGTPVPMNVLIFSADPVAMDATVCRLIDLNPEFVPTNICGLEQGLGTYLADQIELLGDSSEVLMNPKFDVVREPVTSHASSRPVVVLKKWLVPRPVIQPNRCTRCGTCVQVCPIVPKALSWRDADKSTPPRYDDDACIRCYCCQELCPEKAISIRKPLLARAIHRLRRSGYAAA